MGDENQNDQSPLTAISTFAKMVKKQLKKAYNVDVRRLSKKTDKHGQPMAVLKVGSGDEACELWFRDGSDESVVIDKIADGKAVGTIKVNKPICHLRTAAMLDGDAKLPVIAKDWAPEESDMEDMDLEEGAVKRAMQELVDEVVKITGEDWEKVQEHLMDSPISFVEEYGDRLPEELREKLKVLLPGIREEVEKDDELPEEPEDFEEEFTAPTNKMAIVDASVLEGLDNELAEQAIIVPVKHHGAVFEVTAAYDDTILRNLTIVPAEIEQGGVAAVKMAGVGEGPERLPTEGIAPLSNDSSPERAIRKHTSIKQKHHMKHAKDVPVRVKDPAKKAVVKRDQSKKDQRKKKRLSKEDVEAKRNVVKMLLEDRCAADNVDTENLVFAKKVLHGLIKEGVDAKKVLHGLIKEGVDVVQPSNAICKIDETLKARAEDEATELVGHIEWLRKNQRKMREPR